MSFNSAMWRLDEGVTGLFGQWNIYSTVLVTLLIGIVTFHLYTRTEPDTHPMLLARQAQGSSVRQEGESPVYRSRSAPHGMPLNTGLDVRDPGVSKWAKGRDGDLRDIWRRAVGGVPESDAPSGPAVPAASAVPKPVAGARGRILTSFGTDSVVETSLEDVTRQINLIGQHILDQGGARVAIYLPNSVEFLASLFACSFYNMTAILLPFDQKDDAVLVSMLRRSAADTVITAPGCFPFDTVVQSYPALRQLIWVVDEGSAHLDWNEVPEGTGGSVNVSTWQDVVNDAPQAAGRELPVLEGQSQPRDVTIFWEPFRDENGASSGAAASGIEEMVRFTSGNLVSAVAAQLFAVPSAQRVGPSDLFLPADSLTHTHTLVLTLAALYSNASVVFNSVAPRAADLSMATRGIAPTIVVATPSAVLATHDESVRLLGNGAFASFFLKWQTRALTEGGVIPAATSFVSRFFDSVRPTVGKTPGKLRLLYVAERAAAGTPAVSATVLSNLRIFTGARVIYALASAKVAGAAAQTAFYDYRVATGTYAPFGSPLTSTEYLVRSKGQNEVTDAKLQGEIIIRGPSVVGNEAALGVIGGIRDDNTLAYV
ncbi:hypothetical protein HMPREF1624_00048 [Sporothrix schenckii ATCC 58251]|uniref:AMP-dependent synthetase/ligase domain-containing protein n=1 Tax=Sporothrix schenckii (strain ATCC 58251 / de Perez 2211183) TaxID=1391915 RepID=U7Q1H2_SPOS1|nr:hypothetical protein HMPREF1624_00048 [Sporothrix schenckii ATCC 58251]